MGSDRVSVRATGTEQHLGQASVTMCTYPEGCCVHGRDPERRPWEEGHGIQPAHAGPCRPLLEGKLFFLQPSPSQKQVTQWSNQDHSSGFVLVKGDGGAACRLLGAPFKAQLVGSHRASEAGLFPSLSASCSLLQALPPPPPDTQERLGKQTGQQRKTWGQHPAPTFSLHCPQLHGGCPAAAMSV